MKLVSLFREYDRKIRKYCKEQTVNSATSGAASWVTDNYRLCSLALKAAEGFVSLNGEKGLQPLFLLCRSFFSSGHIPSDEMIASFFAGKRLTVIQSEALSVMLQAGAAAEIAESLYSDKEDYIISCIKSLFLLPGIDFDRILFSVCKVERSLCEDPTGEYEKMSAQTRREYRKAVMRGAAKRGVQEADYAKEVIRSAQKENRHVGFFLDFGKRGIKGIVFIISEWLAAAVLSCLASVFFLKSLLWSAVFVLPVYALIKPFTDRLSALLFPPKKPFSMDEEAQESLSCVIAVSSLLPRAAECDSLFEHLSRLYGADSGRDKKIILLLDMKNAPVPELQSDKADTDAVKRLIDRLNEKHSGGFAVAVRDRVFSVCENEFTGYERKRGAITDLARFLRDGGEDTFALLYGDIKGLSDMKYILALDSDTRLSFEVIKKLTATARHPLNAPVYSSSEKRIISGYGIVIPRMEATVESASKTVFSSVFTDGGGSGYAARVCERYQDMFGRTIFCGKGLIDIDAFNAALGDRLDDQRILSHDILEGNVLSCVFCPDAALSDSFPSSPEGYFSRLHRWIRGDVQNLKYVFFPLGKKELSPCMDTLGKYQLIDNFRRAVSPVFSLLLIGAGCFFESKEALLLTLIGILSAVSGDILSAFCAFIRQGIKAFTGLYFSSGISTAVRDILRSAFCLGSLPQNAAVSLDAVLRAAYRSLFSKKRLLQWQTAADADKSGKKRIINAVLFPSAAAVLIFIFGTPLHRFTAVFFLLFLPVYLKKGIPRAEKRNKMLTDNEREDVLSFAASAWKYFAENVSAVENHLPPDNIQETPVRKKAHRTSPTNVGLYLVSVLAAADMAFISRKEMLERINASLDTVDRLPKYKGLLYNWYDTLRLQPLKPSYVSFVDCGNFLVCLTALKQGLLEFSGEEYVFTAARIERMLDSSDMSCLYDKGRGLYSIGIDCETGALSQSFYDLYMSEARMASFLECARRRAPASHWHKLSRALKKSGRYVTAASWTGTMFEYFMPALFLDTVPDTFSYEALKVCLFAQKRRVKKEGIPYGISESCFYSADSSLNYRYKAHGLKSLALKRDADDESVISPYSSFLSLPFDKKSALRNLSRLSSYHCEGEYGFYEAIDFTPSRTDGEDYFIVRCYMAHHIGMSIVAMANALYSDIFVKRFMADSYTESAAILLEEKLPCHYGLLKTFTQRRDLVNKKRKRDGLNRDAPEEGREAFAYSNGELTLFCDKYGRNRSTFSGRELTKYSQRSEGISIGVGCGEGMIPLFPSREGNVRLRKYAAVSSVKEGELEITSAMTVHINENALLLPVKIKNNSDKAQHFSVHWYIEPSLLAVLKEDIHPAFSDMFLGAQYVEKHRAAVFSRKNDSGSPYVAAGLYSKSDLCISLDRESVVSRGQDGSSIFDKSYRCEMNPVRGVFPVLAVKSEVTLQAGKSCESVLILAAGAGADGALGTLSAVRSRGLPSADKGASAVFLRDRLTFSQGCDFIARAFFAGTLSEITAAAKSSGLISREALWKAGISGDVPIITVFPDRNCTDVMLRALIRFHRRLMKSSVPADMVFIFESNNDYDFSGERKLLRMLDEEDMGDMAGKRGGVHIFTLSSLGKDSLAAILGFSYLCFPDASAPSRALPPVNTCAENAGKPENAPSGFIKGGYAVSEEPSLPWSHTLSNNTFGTLVTDGSLGFSWCGNSRLNKLTPWSNDTLTGLTGERLFMKKDGRLYDVIADSACCFYGDSAVFGSIADVIKVSVRVEVPERGNRKRLSVLLENPTDKKCEIQLYYAVLPVLGEKNDEDFLVYEQNENICSAENPLNTDYKGKLFLYAEDGIADVSDEVASYFYGRKKVLAVLQKIAISQNSVSAVRFEMCFAPGIDEARRLLRAPFRKKRQRSPVFTTGYPFFDVFASSLLYHQVSDTRLRARCGFYQCSGAWGFRDQLQDALALISCERNTVKQMIFRAASAQFFDGDVLHWFHLLYREGLIYKGVRTRISDDLLWLPLVVYEYVTNTGDSGILSKKIPYIAGEELAENERDRYCEYRHSDVKESLYMHCLRAIGRGLTHGAHSLALFGTGDWNDSFDRVGEKGQGESVWLSMFIKMLCKKFAKICELMNDTESAALLLEQSLAMTKAIEDTAWNGKWYLRGFYDDGTPLGDEGEDSCEIDVLCQAWASLADMPDKNRVRTALLSAYDRLFDEKNGVIKLFSPPFNEKSRKTGYVNFYPEGMRENGGQYTHAAVWFCTALFKEGLIPQAENVLRALIPSEKYNGGQGHVYKTEPYALAGDVYSAKGHAGRGGWSLYTGSAGWLLQLAESSDRKFRNKKQKIDPIK